MIYNINLNLKKITRVHLLIFLIKNVDYHKMLGLSKFAILSVIWENP